MDLYRGGYREKYRGGIYYGFDLAQIGAKMEHLAIYEKKKGHELT